jgi:hypothetical protein
MGNVGRVFSGLATVAALAAFASVGAGCSGAAGAPVAPVASTASDSSRASSMTAPAHLTQTTLAVGLGDAAEAHDDAKADEPAPLPTTCGAEGSIKDAKLCLPEAGFAKKLCSGSYPEVALGLFGKGTPWTRIYLSGDVEAWNASGGRTHRAKLAFDEEVLVLGKHGAGGGGIVMTGAQASYDVLRWDGSCVSVMEGEITTRRPPVPKPADVTFSRLEESTRHALLATPKVKSTHEALFKACTSVSTPSEKKACEKADKAFSAAIVDAIRSGATLPAPGRRP